MLEQTVFGQHSELQALLSGNTSVQTLSIANQLLQTKGTLGKLEFVHLLSLYGSIIASAIPSRVGSNFNDKGIVKDILDEPRLLFAVVQMTNEEYLLEDPPVWL
jgi:hypothetical protein